MRNEEFEIVRDLISGRGPQVPEPAHISYAIPPASFREIDGQELARQYVAHRKFRESEALALRTGAADATVHIAPATHLRGEHRPSEVSSGGWLSSWTRVLWRR